MKKDVILKVVNNQDYLSVEETAKLLNIKTSAVRNYLHLEKFKTYKFKNLTLLSLKEVEKWKGRKKS